MPTPEYIVEHSDTGWWLITRRQGNSHIEVALCFDEADARMIANALGSAKAGSRIHRAVAKALRSQVKDNQGPVE